MVEHLVDGLNAKLYTVWGYIKLD